MRISDVHVDNAELWERGPSTADWNPEFPPARVCLAFTVQRTELERRGDAPILRVDVLATHIMSERICHNTAGYSISFTSAAVSFTSTLAAHTALAAAALAATLTASLAAASLAAAITASAAPAATLAAAVLCRIWQ